ncbi:retinal pigment epithelial membrane protein-domain-containing protein [Fimicolochytrium jonesii]|uniref:retinal pigment epithelial membrane protein-domain-containing protein n=1 Tax=Fimicolochytrium jonesii TaxID=1396493 RepID=UPI0022FF143B|nr:retinal pigment epithelial membrane protein-domain-containing protein [Fimicolochytrium jonesii]KAI8823678.1 retinal pigment epithelial membrane protein-domain-containing protein [Fimicolochytrium jonesii]
MTTSATKIDISTTGPIVAGPRTPPTTPPRAKGEGENPEAYPHILLFPGDVGTPEPEWGVNGGKDGGVYDKEAILAQLAANAPQGGYEGPTSEDQETLSEPGKDQEEQEPELIRDATGEPIHLHGSVAPGTGTPLGPAGVAKTALEVADTLDVIPPLSVLEAGARVVEQVQEREGEAKPEVGWGDETPKQKPRRDKHALVRRAFEGPAHVGMAEFGYETIESMFNVSQTVDPERYDPRVPYIAGFSNGKEIRDTVILDTQCAAAPTWLKGALYRNGPGIFDLEIFHKRQVHATSFQHWFDALPLVHRFEIDAENQIVKYRSRFTATGLENTIRAHLRKTYVPIVPNMGWLGLKRTSSDPSAICAIHTQFPFRHSTTAPENRLVATTDTSLLQEIDPVTLISKQALRYSDINPAFQGSGAAAVPWRDRKTGDMINYTMQHLASGKAKYTFFGLAQNDRFNPPGNIIATITAPPTYAHTFAVTEKYIVLIVYPYTRTWGEGLKRLVPGWLGMGGHGPMETDPRKGMYFDVDGVTTFHVIYQCSFRAQDRYRREEISVYRTGPMFALNIVNAFEDPSAETVSIDLNCYDNDEILSCWDLVNLRTLEMLPWPAATIRRYVLGKLPETAAIYKVDKSKLPEPTFTHRTDYTLEWPTINPHARQYNEYRFAWGLSISAAKRRMTNVVWDTIVKADLSDKSRREWASDGCYPGQPIFVPNPACRDFVNNPSSGGDVNGMRTKLSPSTDSFVGDNAAEDSGVLLSVVLDTLNDNTSFLLMLDARTMEEVGRATLPIHIPFGFHALSTRVDCTSLIRDGTSP